MAKKKERLPKPQPVKSPIPAHSSSRHSWLLLLPLAVVVLGIGVWWFFGHQPSNSAPTIDLSRSVGGVGACAAIPRFAPSVGFKGNVNFTTSARRTQGVIMFDPAAPPDPNTGSTHYYQHPSWTAAGYLGPVVPDENGNLYVAPVPHINVLDNPASDQTRLYRVDTNTGIMNILMTLPAVALPTAQNPFGALGLTYDCETHTLYATSVAGSTPQKENGRIFHIDPISRTILSEFDNVDALGVGVFNGSTGKRLYFGAARAPEVRSLALDVKGDFAGALRVDFSIGAVARDANDKARRITFAANNDMIINGVQFDYNLIAPSLHVVTFYTFGYDRSSDSWSFKSLSPN